MAKKRGSTKDEISAPKKKIRKDEEAEFESDEVINHQEQLERLKTKDPDFYKFLLDQDEDLLHFGKDELQSGSEADSETSEVEDDVAEEEEEISDEDSNEEEESFEKKTQEFGKSPENHKELTVDTLEKWQKSIKKGELFTVKKIVLVLHQVINEKFGASSDSDENDSESKTFKTREGFNKLKSKKTKHKIPPAPAVKYSCSRIIANKLLIVCLKDLAVHFKKALFKSSSKSNVLKNKKVYPVIWRKYKSTVRIYFDSFLNMLKTLNNQKTVAPVLSTCFNLSSVLVKFSDLTRKYLKVLIPFFRHQDEELRISVFILCKKVITASPKFLIPYLKNCYSLYLDHSKPQLFNCENERKLKEFMMKTINDLILQFPEASLTFVHSSLRFLAAKLRDALIQQNDDTRNKVICWRFLSSINLWCVVLNNLATNQSYIPLIHAIVQITISAVKYKFIPRYFPFHVNCMRSLLPLMQTKKLYIPLGLLITQMLCDPFMLKEAKNSTAKPFIFKHRLHASNSIFQTQIYQKCSSEEIIDLLLEFLSIWASSIAFPELSIPITLMISKFAKSSKKFQLQDSLLTLDQKIQENTKIIMEKRKSVNFSPIDIDAVTNWENDISQKLSTTLPIVKHFLTVRKIKAEIEAQIESFANSKDENIDEEEENIDDEM